jgi:hypothetical protein
MKVNFEHLWLSSELATLAIQLLHRQVLTTDYINIEWLGFYVVVL